MTKKKILQVIAAKVKKSLILELCISCCYLQIMKCVLKNENKILLSKILNEKHAISIRKIAIGTDIKTYMYQ